MSYIWNVHRHFIDANTQLRIYPFSGRKAAVFVVHLKNEDILEKTTKGLTLIECQTGTALVPDDNDDAYHCSMDTSVNIYYNEKYIFTLETVPIWKINTNSIDSPLSLPKPTEEEPNTI